MGTAALKKRLKQTIETTRSQLLEIENADRDERNKKFVGRYFRYRNCYSCPEKSSDYWWMYFRVIGVREGYLLVQKFQNDNRGRITIETDDMFSVMLDGTQEIKKQQYEKAFAKTMEAASAVADVARNGRQQ